MQILSRILNDFYAQYFIFNFAAVTQEVKF
jgi:hypothetical protein